MELYRERRYPEPMLRTLACLAFAVASAFGVASSASGVSEAARCRPTVGVGAGPFQQGRVTAPRRAKIGKGHVLLGRVVRAPDCAPVAGARVVLWQSGPKGYTSRTRGSVVTNRLGRFRFQGPVPASYSGGAPHIHIAVYHPVHDELVTRYVVRRGSKTGRITLILAPLL
jgi:protocatechuate 3,4-dioxygenase beta subunit